MMMMTVPMMMVVMPVMVVVPVNAWAGVVALLNPAPAVPDRSADQGDRLGKAVLSGNPGNRRARQGLGAAAGQRSRKCHSGGEHQATHFE